MVRSALRPTSKSFNQSNLKRHFEKPPNYSINRTASQSANRLSDQFIEGGDGYGGGCRQNYGSDEGVHESHDTGVDANGANGHESTQWK
jgi:hypothetical protein